MFAHKNFYFDAAKVQQIFDLAKYFYRISQTKGFESIAFA